MVRSWVSDSILTWTLVCMAAGTTPMQKEGPSLQPTGKEGKQAARETVAREAESDSRGLGRLPSSNQVAVVCWPEVVSGVAERV